MNCFPIEGDGITRKKIPLSISLFIEVAHDEMIDSLKRIYNGAEKSRVKLLQLKVGLEQLMTI